MNVYEKYGHVDKDKSYCHRDDAAFVKREQNTIIVCQKDELSPLLAFDDDSLNVSNDVSLLLNSRRLDNADPKAVADMIRRRFVEKGVSSSVFEGLTDQQIFANIKSRHIQSMSELDSYSEYLAASLGDSIHEQELKKSLEDVKDVSKEDVKDVSKEDVKDVT